MLNKNIPGKLNYNFINLKLHVNKKKTIKCSTIVNGFYYIRMDKRTQINNNTLKKLTISPLLS